MSEEKEPFTITCNECGGTDVYKTGTDGLGVYFYCNQCENED